MIQIQHLSKSYGTQPVLQDIQISFESGNVYGIVGENGAGKTTFFRCIAGLETFEGHLSADRMPLKNYLGFLNTDPYFLSKITGEEYIRLLTNARGLKIDNIQERNIFDLPLQQYAANYSTGMKKKLALTAILLQENQYFILDEPFNGVDIQSNILITEIIHRLKALKKTILISSHIFSTLNETCDEIHLLQKGRFVRSVGREAFHSLEEEMKHRITENTIERLKLH